MFISKKEKQQLYDSIAALKKKIGQLESRGRKRSARLTELEHTNEVLKSMLVNLHVRFKALRKEKHELAAFATEKAAEKPLLKTPIDLEPVKSKEIPKQLKEESTRGAVVQKVQPLAREGASLSEIYDVLENAGEK